MAHRKKVKMSKDRKIFKTTSSKTKKINIDPKIMRGGIRL